MGRMVLGEYLYLRKSRWRGAVDHAGEAEEHEARLGNGRGKPLGIPSHTPTPTPQLPLPLPKGRGTLGVPRV